MTENTPDMSPERIWIWPDEPHGEIVVSGPNDLYPSYAVNYVRADLYNAAIAQQTYTYIGKDGKPVLARDLEDERDALRVRVKALEEALRWVHNNPTAHPENRKRVVKGALDARHDQPDQGGGQ